MTKRAWYIAVPLLALGVRQVLIQSSALPATAAPALSAARHERAHDNSAFRRGAQPGTSVSAPAPVLRAPAVEPSDDDEAWRARARSSAMFSRLPPPDQDWVLAQARARVKDITDPRVEQLVEELSQIRLFAVSEREEPLPPQQATLNPSR